MGEMIIADLLLDRRIEAACGRLDEIFIEELSSMHERNSRSGADKQSPNTTVSRDHGIESVLDRVHQAWVRL